MASIRERNGKFNVIYFYTNEFVGYCGIKNLTQEIPELAIELLSKYRKNGYGFQALSLLMDQFSEITGEHVFRSRVEVDNYASQALHRKLGAVPNGMSEFLIPRKLRITYVQFFVLGIYFEKLSGYTDNIKRQNC